MFTQHSPHYCSVSSIGIAAPSKASLPFHFETPTSPKMPLLRPRNALLLFCVAIACVYAEKASFSIASMSMPEIEEKLQASRDLARSPIYLSLSLDSPFLTRQIGMPPRAGPKYPQTRDFTANVYFNVSDLRSPLPGLPSHERPPSNALHLWASEFPLGIMSAEYRSFELVCHGRVRGGRVAG